MASEKITPRRDDFSDCIPVRGCMVVRPYGWALRENLQDALDQCFKNTGHVNVASSLFIPFSLLERDGDHVEGFSPELGVMTVGEGKIMSCGDPLVVKNFITRVY